MEDNMIAIITIAIYTVMMPSVIRYIEKRVARRWVAYLLSIVIGMIIVATVGTIVAVATYCALG